MKKVFNNLTAKQTLKWASLFAVLFFFLGVFGFFNTKPTLGGSFHISQDTTIIGISLILCLVSVIWRAQMKKHCTDNSARFFCSAIATITLFWNIVALISYLAPQDNSSLLAFLCCLRIVPLIIIPSLLFFCILRIINFSNKRVYRIILIFLSISSAALSVFALTNNLHMQIFWFDPSNVQTLSSLQYRWGFFLIYGWLTAQLLSFFISLYVSVQRDLYSSGLSFLFVTLSLIILYPISSFVRSYSISDIHSVFIYSLLFFLLLDGCMFFRIIPSTRDYSEALMKIPFQLFIYPRFPSNIFMTEKTSELSKEETHALLQAAIVNKANGNNTFRIEDYQNYLYHTYDVTGGLVILGEDISPVISRRAELESRQKLLETQISILHDTLAIQEQLKKQETENQLIAEIEESLKTALSRSNNLFNYLIESYNDLSEKERRLALFEVKMITSYAKRKSNLIIASHNDETFNSKRLELVISEACMDLRTIGFTCACIVNASKNLDAMAVNALYDYFFAVILSVLNYENVVIMVSINEISDTETHLHIVIEYSNPIKDNAHDYISQLKSRFKNSTPSQIKDISLLIDEDTIDFSVIAFIKEEE